MARLRATFWIYVTACVVVVHLVLLPALYFGMGYVIRESHEDLFVDHARTFSRVLADEFEVGAAMDSQTRIEDLLDFAITHGGARYAELYDRGQQYPQPLWIVGYQDATLHGFELWRRRRRHLLRRTADRARVAIAPNCAWASTSSLRRSESSLH